MKKIKIFATNKKFGLGIFFLDLFMLLLLVIMTSISLKMPRIYIFLIFFCLWLIVSFIGVYSLYNKSSWIIILTSKYICVFHSILFFRVYSSKKRKVILSEYFSYPPFCSGNYRFWYGTKNIIVDYNEDSSYVIHSLYFIVSYKDVIDYCTRNEKGETFVNQENYDEFIKIMSNKRFIVLDGTYSNYKFLRQQFKVEDFIDNRKINDVLLNYEKRYQEKNHK